jgi:hypothetical protein
MSPGGRGGWNWPKAVPATSAAERTTAAVRRRKFRIIQELPLPPAERLDNRDLSRVTVVIMVIEAAEGPFVRRAIEAAKRPCLIPGPATMPAMGRK